jgi:molybdopterin-guanine dinucleotide biosynthesis protein A
VSGVVGAILAGGEATRLGRPKATAPLAGRRLIDYPLAALREGGLETVVVAKRDTPLPAVDVTIWREDAEPVHPLLGVVTSLERAEGQPVLACACDLPFVTAELAAWMAARDAPLAVPRVGGRLHPLFARCTPGLLPALRDALERRAPLHETLTALDPLILEGHDLAELGDPERLLFNVNTPSDLARAEAILRRDDDIESLKLGFESFNKGDVSQMLAFSAPDVVVHDAPELPGGGVHRGREALGRALEEFRAMFDDLTVEPKEIARHGDRILVVFRAIGRGAESGIPVDVELGNVFTMKDGIVQEWRSYIGAAQAREALGLDPEGS